MCTAFSNPFFILTKWKEPLVKKVFSVTFFCISQKRSKLCWSFSNNMVWHFPQHIWCIHRIFPKYSNYLNANIANSDEELSAMCSTFCESKGDPKTNLMLSIQGTNWSHKTKCELSKTSRTILQCSSLMLEIFLHGRLIAIEHLEASRLRVFWPLKSPTHEWSVSWVALEISRTQYFSLLDLSLLASCQFDRGPSWKEAGVSMVKTSTFQLLIRSLMKKSEWNIINEKALYTYKTKLVITLKTSQELGKCPMGQREALLKKGFFEMNTWLKNSEF